jgi:hypothetical protein
MVVSIKIQISYGRLMPQHLSQLRTAQFLEVQTGQTLSRSISLPTATPGHWICRSLPVGEVNIQLGAKFSLLPRRTTRMP